MECEHCGGEATRLGIALAKLRKRHPSTEDCVFMGVPMQEFEREDLIRIALWSGSHDPIKEKSRG